MSGFSGIFLYTVLLNAKNSFASFGSKLIFWLSVLSRCKRNWDGREMATRRAHPLSFASDKASSIRRTAAEEFLLLVTIVFFCNLGYSINML